MPHETYDFWESAVTITIASAAILLAWVLLRTLMRSIGNGIATVYEWEYALLYVNGRFARMLPPGRHVNFGFARHNVYKLNRHDQFLVTPSLDVTSADKLLFRLASTVTYAISDPQTALETKDHEAHLRIAAANALTRLAADHKLEAFLCERAALGERIQAMVSSPVAGCTIKAMTITSVTLPPEIRRMFTEVERAKLEGLVSLERARGEQAALRSLANAARMLKGNPALMNLRLLQTLSASDGKSRPTVVLGLGALLPLGDEVPASEE